MRTGAGHRIDLPDWRPARILIAKRSGDDLLGAGCDDARTTGRSGDEEGLADAVEDG